MGYSLLSRFRGTFLGVAIAESQEGRVDEADLDSSLMVASAESLIRCGGLDLRDWQQHCLGDRSAEIPPQAGWLAMLPIALFYHEDEVGLEQQLKRAISLWPEMNSREAHIMTIGWAIAHGLTKKATPITHILKRLKDGGKNDLLLGENLSKINRLLAESASLETAMSQLAISNAPDSTALALALYCFLSTAEDFQLSVQRAALTQPQPHLTKLLTGALSGAYNSCAGMPMTWQLAEETPTYPSRILQQITVADRLFTTWSGLYDRADKPLKPLMMAVAAPNVLSCYG